MKKLLSLLIVCTLTRSVSCAAEPHEALETLRFPPDLVISRADELGLSIEQRDKVKGLLQKAQEQFPQLQQELRAEMEKLQPLLRDARVDESAARPQFEAMLQKENAVKTMQFSLLLQIRNILEPDQWAKVRSLQEKPQAEDFGKKVRRVQEGVKRWQAEGRNPEPIGQEMEKFGDLMKAGRSQEAQKHLDRALDLLTKPGE